MSFSQQHTQPDCPAAERLTGALIGLARATDGNEHLISESSTAVILEGLSATHPRAGSAPAALEKLLNRVEEEKRKMVPDCFHCASPCGRTNAYDLRNLEKAEREIRGLKSQLLSGIREIAASVCRSSEQSHLDSDAARFLYKALIVIGIEEFRAEDLLPILRELEEVKRRCTASLDA